LVILEPDDERKNVKMTKEFWNERYADSAYIYGTEPNTYFRLKLDSISKGKLLLPAEGEGRNALYAASLGWQVDAFDYSELAKRKAEILAANAGLTLNYRIMAAEDMNLEPDSYDVIGLFYFHLPAELRLMVHKACIKALKPGGTILMEAFTPEQLQYNSGGPKNETWLYTPEMIQSDFAELNIAELTKITIQLEEGEGHKGEASVLRLMAVKP